MIPKYIYLRTKRIYNIVQASWLASLESPLATRCTQAINSYHHRKYKNEIKIQTNIKNKIDSKKIKYHNNHVRKNIDKNEKIKKLSTYSVTSIDQIINIQISAVQIITNQFHPCYTESSNTLLQRRSICYNAALPKLCGGNTEMRLELTVLANQVLLH